MAAMQASLEPVVLGPNMLISVRIRYAQQVSLRWKSQL